MTKGAIPGTLDGLFREEDELNRLEAELRERRELVRRARQEMDTLTPTHHLAILLHDRLCKWNHTDGCGWHYFVRDGVHDWNEHAHQEYLRRANRVMQRLGRGPVTQDNIHDFLNDVLKN